MTDNIIKLNKDNILRLKIETSEGEDTGEILEFDLEDLELPLRYQELIEKDKKNKENLRNQLLIIEKREDVKGKKLFSKNEEDSIRALNEFFKKETEVYNMFLGENGVQKLLNGRRMGWTTLKEIDEIIETQITPHIDLNIKKITDKIHNKYSSLINKEKEVLKVDE